jgi:Zincin-like metallopeptidase
MDWYFVVKTINGHRYRYRQKTWREGKRVRTRSEYIGPAGNTSQPRDLSGAVTLTLPFPDPSRTRAREFDPAVTERSLHALIDNDASHEKWEHAWSATRRGKNLVQQDPRIKQLLAVLDVKVTDETRGAFYSPLHDVVNIPPAKCFKDKVDQTATQAYHVVLFHELVHWTLAAGRTGRGHTDYAKEELVAELGAIMLMNHFELEIGNIGRHAKYFQIWLSRTDDESEALRHAKKEAERAVQFVLKHGTIDE